MKLSLLVICLMALLSTCLSKSYSYSKQSSQPSLRLVPGNRDILYSTSGESNGAIVNDAGYEFTYPGEKPIPQEIINQILDHYSRQIKPGQGYKYES